MALSEAMFTEKMDKLSSTQQSIENTSSWCSLWRSDARNIVTWWEGYFTKANQSKRLCMIYLASDVVQTSRKKGPEFVTEFYKVLPRALRHFLTKADEKSKASVAKVVKVWEDRRVFGSSASKTLHQLIDEANKGAASKSASRGAPADASAAVPASVASVASAASAVEAAASQAAGLIPNAIQLQVEMAAAAPEQATAIRQMLQNCLEAVQREISSREALIGAMQAAINSQTAAISDSRNIMATLEAKLAALTESQATAPSALSPVMPSGPGGVEATVDAAEAAALAAQLMQNPQALIDAIAATMPAAGGDGGGNGAADAGAIDEYDPENW